MDFGAGLNAVANRKKYIYTLVENRDQVI